MTRRWICEGWLPNQKCVGGLWLNPALKRFGIYIRLKRGNVGNRNNSATLKNEGQLKVSTNPQEEKSRFWLPLQRSGFLFNKFSMAQSVERFPFIFCGIEIGIPQKMKGSWGKTRKKESAPAKTGTDSFLHQKSPRFKGDFRAILR